MGLRFNKSFNIGKSFRVNLSKSGIGYSFGGKGIRFTKTAKGKTRRTFCVPGTGISYVSESGGKSKHVQNKQYVSKGMFEMNEKNDMNEPINSTPEKKGNFKKVLLWILTGFCVIASLVYFPSFASFMALLASAIMAPIKPWQELIGRFFNKKLKVILAVVFSVLMIFTAPSSTDSDNADLNGNDDGYVVYEETADTLDVTKDTEGTTDDSTEADTEKTHEHSFSAATCTELAKCQCGETRGELAEHNWQEASCISPKTCTVCSAAEGEAKGHSWKESNCTEPKTCGECDIAEGEPAGHSWQNATCTLAKTCAVCAVTEGYANGHSYISGKCGSCGEIDPYYVEDTMVWIPTNGGTKYHSYASCSKMKDPVEVTEDEAKARGFTPCKRCH